MERLRDFWVRVALAFAVALPFYFLASALGARLGLFDWRFALHTMTLNWGRLAIYGALAFAAIGLIMAFAIAPPRGRRLALFSLLVPAGALGWALYGERALAAGPPLHDISTDLMDPPQFSERVSAARRQMGGNSLDLLHERTADGRASIDVQRQAFPDIDSIPTGLAPQRAFDIAAELARQQHWRITMADAPSGSIEATTEDFWFGFADDIAVRVRPDGSGARIDMRSSSRVGDSDGGANARRVQTYMNELRRRLQEAESH